MTTKKRIRTVLTLAAVAMAVFAGSAQAGPLEGQLGLLDLTKDYGAGAGSNPATENPWASGDPYHLIYVTSTLRDATSTDINDYNAFVQADADAEGIGATRGVNWSVLGSTATVNATDNVAITGPVFGIYDSKYVALDAADFWDLVFPSSGLILTLAGEPKNAWTGTGGGGVALRPFGGTPNVEFDWTGWQNWVGAMKNGPATELREMVALSDPLVIVGEIDPNIPDVDAGADVITWSGQAVQLDPNVVEKEGSDWTDLTYLWSAEPADGVEFSDPDVLAPTVTITKATDNPSAVTLTLAVNNVGRVDPPVEDTMTIDVYDDSCLAAEGAGTVVFDSTDFNQDCITNFADFAVLATTWLEYYMLTEPVVK